MSIKPRSTTIGACILLSLHMGAIYLGDARSSQLVTVLAPAIAAAVAFRGAVQTKANRFFWNSVGLGFSFYTAASSISFYYLGWRQVPQPTPCFADVLYFLYGFPLMLAALHLRRMGGLRSLRITLDLGQLLISIAVSYIALYFLPAQLKLSDFAVISNLYYFYNVENFFLIALYAIAILLEKRPARRRATITVAYFVVVYGICATVANWLQLHGDFQRLVSLSDLGWSIPFLFFAAHRSWRKEEDDSADTTDEAYLTVPDLTPALVPFASLAMAWVIAKSEPRLAVAIVGVSGIIFGIRIMFTNREHRKEIVARRNAERESAATTRTYRTLLGNVPGTVFRCKNDKLWTAEFVTPTIEDLTGIPASEFLLGRRNFSELIVMEDQRRVWEAVQTAVERRQQWNLEFRIIDSCGRRRHVWGRGCAIRDEQGEIEALEGFMADVTEEHSMRAQLEQNHRLESVGRLAAGIAHDFNNLLMIISGYAEMLERAATMRASEQQLKLYSQRILEASDRAARLTSQLLAFGGRQLLEVAPIEVNSFFSKTLTMLSRLLGEKIRIIFDPHFESLYISANDGQLTQVVLNLAVNARDAMPDGGLLKVAIRPSEDERDIKITMADTGPGFAPQDIPYIFEPFFTTKAPGEGSGLGLATVYGIIKQSGGEIEASNVPVGGARFSIRLPRIPTPAALIPEAPKVNRHNPSGTVLVVEDEAAVLEVATNSLREAGLKVIGTQSGKAALELADSEDVSWLVTDVVMPDCDGRELATKMQARKPGLRVILMTGYATESSGFDRDFEILRKPFPMRDLVTRIATSA